MDHGRRDMMTGYQSYYSLALLLTLLLKRYPSPLIRKRRAYIENSLSGIFLSFHLLLPVNKEVIRYYLSTLYVIYLRMSRPCLAIGIVNLPYIPKRERPSSRKVDLLLCFLQRVLYPLPFALLLLQYA